MEETSGGASVTTTTTEGTGATTAATGDEAKACPRGHWRPGEDEKLRQLVEQYGPQNWNSIAEKLQGRSGTSGSTFDAPPSFSPSLSSSCGDCRSSIVVFSSSSSRIHVMARLSVHASITTSFESPGTKTTEARNFFILSSGTTASSVCIHVLEEKLN